MKKLAVLIIGIFGILAFSSVVAATDDANTGQGDDNLSNASMF